MIKKPGRATDGPIRLPADELEELVISQVQSFLQSPQRMQDVLCDPDAGSVEIQGAADFARKWAAATGVQVRAVVPSIAKRIVVKDGLIELQLSKSAIREAVTGLRDAPSRLDDSGSREDLVILKAGATVSKCRGAVRLILAPDAAPGSPRAIPSLVKAIARAHDWVDRIAKGELPHQRAIAAETGLHRRYVGRIIQMAFLAPDITEAILEGRQPPDMTLDTLMADLPADWHRQRKHLLASSPPDDARVGAIIS